MITTMFGFDCCATAGADAIVTAVKQVANRPSHLIRFINALPDLQLRELNSFERSTTSSRKRPAQFKVA
jgi:hypothetical protein